MVEYLSGGRIQGSTALVSSPPQTEFVELDRVKLSDAGDTFDITGLTTTDYPRLMIIGHYLGNGQEISPDLQFNGSSGTGKYPIRRSNDGAADDVTASPSTLNYSYLYTGMGGQNSDRLIVYNILNINGQEKLIFQDQVINVNRSNAGTAPTRNELFGKWIGGNNSNDNPTINRVRISGDYTSQTGDFEADSEVIVLGAKSSGTNSGNNFWQELKNKSDTSNHTTFDSGAFADKRYLMFEFRTVSNNTNSAIGQFKCNSDSGSSFYSRRWTQYQSNATNSSGTATTDATIDWLTDSLGGSQNNAVQYVTGYIANLSGQEKLMLIHSANSRGGVGAGNGTYRKVTAGKYVPSSLSTGITSLQFGDPNGSGWSQSQLRVWGAN